MKKKTGLLKLLCCALILSCATINSGFSQMPANYKGKPFDNARYMSNYYFKLIEKATPPFQFTPAKVVWDAKMPKGSGWPLGNSDYASMSLTTAGNDSLQLIHFKSKSTQWSSFSFGWNWAAPQEEGIDPKQYDAFSFSVKFAGKSKVNELFMSLSGNSIPVSISKYCPNFLSGAWQTVTIPIRDFKWNQLATAKDSSEVRGISFFTKNWDFKDCRYELYFDHITFDQVSKPIVNKQYKFVEFKGHKIPGKVECASYDLGGEGVAYHDGEDINTLSGILNQTVSHERPYSHPYLWDFRKDEGVDISFTKDFADYSHPNSFDPPANQLYVGNTALGEWINYTVDVEKAGKYKVIAVFGGAAKTFKLTVNNQQETICKTLVGTTSPHIWTREEVGTISFSEAGLQLLTLTVLEKAATNFAYFEFEPIKK